MTDWITIALGVYGVLLTTILVINVLTQNMKKMQVSVNTSLIGSPSNLREGLSISFMNRGKRQIQIDGCGFRLPNKRVVTVIRPLVPFNFPVMIPEGRGYSYHANIRTMASTIQDEGFSGNIKIRGFVRDASGKKYFSKKMKFDINRWLGN